MSRKDFICSFCNRKQTEVKKLIVGPSVYICDFCTNICAQILQENDLSKEAVSGSIDTLDENGEKQKPLTPQEIYNKLDEVAASQEDAKRELALAAYLHHLKIKQYKETHNLLQQNHDNKPLENTVKLNKNNLLLIGPTGSGKTLLVHTLSKILDVAHVIIDANSLTEAGYVGEDADGIVKKLFFSVYSEGQNLQECINKTEFGVICIDEIDKKYSMDSMTNRDVSGKGVQQNLLRIIEGTDVQISLDSKKSNETITINTSNILFITMGAFEGLDKIINRQIKQSNALGVIDTNKQISLQSETASSSIEQKTPNIYFLKKKEEEYNKLIPFFKKDYLLEFGIIKELLGRLHTIVFFKKLSEEDLIDILCTKKNNLIEEYKYILQLHNVQLIYDETVIKAIVHEAISDNMGARSLRSIVHRIFTKALFTIPELYQQNPSKKHILTLIKTDNGIESKIEEVQNNSEFINDIDISTEVDKKSKKAIA